MSSIMDNIYELIYLITRVLNLILNFTLPESAWLNNYYLPMEKELPRLNKKYQGNEVALAIFESFKNELIYPFIKEPLVPNNRQRFYCYYPFPV
ncbi:hypothetical protein LCGC14_2549510 [marine sediment metagenome]|uniref:Uncharacterized protein n=1 Tax=marine sediment metagenome TaxID=412755 RepID=A0A0F9AN56_9ZZZZ